MLLRAYIIRLADGLVAWNSQISVLTDLSVAPWFLFADAKVGKSPDCSSQLTSRLCEIFLAASPSWLRWHSVLEPTYAIGF